MRVRPLRRAETPHYHLPIFPRYYSEPTFVINARRVNVFGLTYDTVQRAIDDS